MTALPTDRQLGPSPLSTNSYLRANLSGCQQSFSTFGPAIDISSSSADLKMGVGVQSANEADFDFGSFFMIPLNWPRNLPAPCKPQSLLVVLYLLTCL
jgi:hypothetical protein